MGISSPHFSNARDSCSRIVGVSSQWVATKRGVDEKIISSILGASTSIFPVLAPMNTFTPQVSLGLMLLTSSILSLVAPR